MTAADTVVNSRRKLLDAQLKEHKQERLKRKLPADAQFLAMAQDDMGLKRQLLADMQAAEKQHAANFSALSQTMMQLSQTMERGNILASPSHSTSYPQPGYVQQLDQACHILCTQP